MIPALKLILTLLSTEILTLDLVKFGVPCRYVNRQWTCEKSTSLIIHSIDKLNEPVLKL